MEFLYFFILGLLVFIIGFIFYYPYHIKKFKKPELGVKRVNRLDYLGDGIKHLLYHRSIAIMLMGISIMIFTIIMLVVDFFK